MVIVSDKHIPLIHDVVKSHELLPVSPFEITNALLLESKADAVLVRSITHVSEELLHDTNVSFVGSATAGMDHIDTRLFHSPTIRVVGAPGCNANAVAEYVVVWLNHLGVSSNATIGIVGFGNVGQRVARLALQRGHRVIVNDPPLADLGFQFPTLVQHESLDVLIAQSDVITLHTPLTPEGLHPTLNLFNEYRLGKLRSGSLLINTSRGEIIDENAVLRRVSTNDIRCVLDVFCHEPEPSIKTIETVEFCTPHIAGYSETAKYQGARMILKALRQHFSLYIPIPELTELTTRRTSSEEDAHVITEHPFRTTYLAEPSAHTFEESRRLTPLRAEHLQPPTWDELNGNRS